MWCLWPTAASKATSTRGSWWVRMAALHSIAVPLVSYVTSCTWPQKHKSHHVYTPRLAFSDSEEEVCLCDCPRMEDAWKDLWPLHAEKFTRAEALCGVTFCIHSRAVSALLKQPAHKEGEHAAVSQRASVSHGCGLDALSVYLSFVQAMSPSLWQRSWSRRCHS